MATPRDAGRLVGTGRRSAEDHQGHGRANESDGKPVVRLVGLSLTNGAATGAGGAIRSLAEELTLEECQILDSSATTDGGAIYATGALNLLESTLAGNSATDGGAIMLDGAAAFIRQSTIAENSATNGAGIALENVATATILQSTVALNAATGSGGGISIDSGYVLMHNTLVADNSAATYADIDGQVLAESTYNLISDSSGLTGIDTSLGNLLDVDALLGELDYHGGPTQTIPLRVDSPALDAGSTDLALTRLGQSSTIVYDSLGRVVQETSVDPDGIGPEEASVVSYTYDANGNLLTETDPLGNVTTYEYDHLGQLVLVTWADPDDFTASGGSDGPLNSPTLAFQYDAVGRIVAEIESYADSSAQQLVTEYAYDYLGRTVSVTQPDPDDYTSSGGADGSETAPVTTYTYNASGDLLLVTDSAGTETSYEYDSLHRLVQVTQDDGGISAETSYLYDAVGNVILIEDAEGRYTAYEYNLYGEVTTIVVDPVTWDDGSGPVTLNANGEALTYTYAYDAVGNLVSQTDPATGTTTYAYDNLGRLLATTLDDSTSTVYAYDDLGNLESVTDAEGNTTRYGYNNLGWLTSETIIVDSVAYTETYEYDAVGQLVQTTDREGRVILYDYDNLGRVYQERWEEDLGTGLENVDTITYQYDDLGNLVSASEVDGSSASVGADYDYTYDLLGRVTELVADLDGLTPDVTFDQTYDSLGNRTELAVTVGSTLDYVNDATYDALSRLVELSQSSQTGGNDVAEKLVTFDYDATGYFSQIARYADLAATELVALTDYTFDTAGQLTELSHNGGGLATDIDYTFTYADSLLDTVTLVDGTMEYSYDGVGQLTGVDYTGTGLPDDDAYTYDDTGNRTDSSFVTGDHNRLLSDDTYTYLYDANGNRTARFVDADSSGTLNSGDTSITEYTWDHRNRLTTVTDRATYGASATQVVTFEYDAYNRLVHKELDSDGDGTGSATDTFWIYDGDQAVLQFDGNAAADLSHRYLWGPVVDQLLADETVDDGGTEDVLWAFTDWQGSVRHLASYDESTSVTSIENHKFYDAFGNVASETNSAVDTVFGYTGRYFDDDLDLQNNLNRWYDPEVGRWLTEDPADFGAGDPNLYRYVGNSPGDSVDPSGLGGAGSAGMLGMAEYYAKKGPTPTDAFIESLASQAWELLSTYAEGGYYLATSSSARSEFGKTYYETRVQALGNRLYNKARMRDYTDAQIGNWWAIAPLGEQVLWDVVPVDPTAEWLEEYDMGEQTSLEGVALQQRGCMAFSGWCGTVAGATSLAGQTVPGLGARMYPQAYSSEARFVGRTGRNPATPCEAPSEGTFGPRTLGAAERPFNARVESEVIDAMGSRRITAESWELRNLSRPHAVAELDPNLGPNQVRYQAQFYDHVNQEYVDISVNYDPDSNVFGIVKEASGK